MVKVIRKVIKIRVCVLSFIRDLMTGNKTDALVTVRFQVNFTCMLAQRALT